MTSPLASARTLPSLRWPLAGVLLLTAVAALVTRLLLPVPVVRAAALLGVGASALAATLILVMKRLALERGIRYALAVTGLGFLVRLLLLLVGAVWVRTHGMGLVPFAVGFLVVFGASQWLEIAYVATAGRAAR